MGDFWAVRNLNCRPTVPVRREFRQLGLLANRNGFGGALERQAVILMTHGGSLVHSKTAQLPDVAFSLATGAHSDQAESPEHLAEVSCRVSGGGPGSVDLQQGRIGPFVPATRNEFRHRPGRHDVSYPSSMRQDLLEAYPGEFGRSEHRDIPSVVV